MILHRKSDQLTDSLQYHLLNYALEVKLVKAREFEGYGATFGNVDRGGDIVAKGAFAATLAEHKAAGTMPKMFWSHDRERVPGKWTSMEEDAKGLRVNGVLAETPLGDEMLALLRMDAVDTLSIGFRIRDWRNDVEFDEQDHRILKRIELWEVSIVSLPMNPEARVTDVKHAVSRTTAKGERVPTALELAGLKRKLEGVLRDEGVSNRRAVSMVARIFDDNDGAIPGIEQRDAGTVDDESLLESMARLIDKVGAAALRS